MCNRVGHILLKPQVLERRKGGETASDGLSASIAEMVKTPLGRTYALLRRMYITTQSRIKRNKVVLNSKTAQIKNRQATMRTTRLFR